MATKYLVDIQHVEEQVRDAYYAMPLSDLLDLSGAKLDKVNDSCYDYNDACFEESRSYNIVRSIYFNRLGETGPQVAVFFDQLTDAYFMCQQEEEESELCEYLHDMQIGVYEWAAPRYSEDIATYAWLIDELLEAEEEPLYSDPTSDELVQYALDRINEDRAKFDLPPVSLSTNQAAQIHAEDVFGSKFISHWMTNGEKPYMTYSKNGGTGGVSQNVAIWGYEEDYDGCHSGEYLCEVIDPFKAIDELQYSMMYDDADSDWGHRDNILYPYHTHVSIGIAYDEYYFSFVQNFEDNYVILSGPPFRESRNSDFLDIEGQLTDRSLTPLYLEVFYDELPSQYDYLRNRDQNWYGFGPLVNCVFYDDSWYCEDDNGNEVPTIEASSWGSKTTSSIKYVDISVNLGAVFGEIGVYTFVLVLEDKDGDLRRGFSYSYFNQP